MRTLIFSLIVSLAFGPVAQAMSAGQGRCGETATTAQGALSISTSSGEAHSVGLNAEQAAPAATSQAGGPCQCACCHCPPGYQCSSSIGLMSSPPPFEGVAPADPVPLAGAMSIATVDLAPANPPPISSLR